MTPATILEVITGAFKFFDQVLWLVRTLQKTPQEQHEDLMKKVQAESDKFAKTGRPTW